MSNNLYTVERTPGKPINWKEGQKEFICSLYKEGVPINEIKRRFGGLHHTTITKILNENDVEIRTRSQSKMKYDRDHTIFHTIDSPNKAYWLGFMSSDGFVGRNQDGSGINTVGLSLKDQDSVEKFKNFLKTNQEIKYEKKPGVWTLRFQDKEMAIDLVNHGIFNNKSLVLRPPEIPNNYEYAYIRGYFDGDGGVNVGNHNGTDRIQMYFTGTYEVLEWIKERLVTNAKIFREHRCENNTFRINISGTNYCKQNFDLMYKDSTEETRMNRKYNIFKNYFNGRFNE